MKLYSEITIYFFIWIVLLLLIFSFGFASVVQVNGASRDLFKNLANWDGGHYLTIAQFGYQQKYQYAFFPLYPLVINQVAKITGNYLTAALLISALSSFLTTHFLFKLIVADFSKNIAKKVIIYLLFFPTSFYLITAYSEGFFLLLIILSFYFFKKNILLTTVFVSLATATRVTGLALAAALIIQVIISSKKFNKNFVILLCPLGFLVYCVYLYKVTGDPFYFMAAESQNWQRNIVFPGYGFWNTLQILARTEYLAYNLNNFLDLLFAVFGLGMGLRAFRFLPLHYAVYGFLSILIPLLTSTLMSFPRFLLPVFPIFILMALSKNKYLIFFYQFVSVLLLAAFAILFINGFWVA